MGPIRREQICKAAVAVIGREGFAGTTMRLVAEEAGVSTGMLNHYFANRQELLMQALDYVSSRNIVRYRAAIEGVEPGVERLRALLDSVLGEDPESEESWRVWINTHGEAVRMPELRSTIEQTLGRWFAIVDEALEGLVPQAHDSEIPWSICLDSVLTGFVLLQMTSDVKLSRRRIREEVIAIMLAHGQARRPAPPWADGSRAPLPSAGRPAPAIN